MSTYELISILISAISIITVLITLIFVIRQTSALTRQTEIQSKTLAQSTYETIEGIVLQIDIQFLANNEIRPYFYSNKEIDGDESDETYRKVVIMCELLYDFFDHILTLLDMQKEATEWSRPMWEDWICDMFSTGPALRQNYADKTDWYQERLTYLWKKVLDQMKQEKGLDAAAPDPSPA